MEIPLTFDIEADELEIFLQDVNEHLQALETGILRLEQRPELRAEPAEGPVEGGAGFAVAADPDTLNAVFRAAHTLKAVAATVGHHQMAELTHTLETLFDRMREGSLSLFPTQEVADELLAAVDALKALRDEVVSRQPSGLDVAAILTRLRELTDNVIGEERDQAVQQGSVGDLRPSRELGVVGTTVPVALTPEQAAQAQDYCQEGHIILEVKVTACADAFAPAGRLLQAAMALMEVGHVIAQHPSQADLANPSSSTLHSPFSTLWLVLATQADEGAVEELLGDVSDLAEFQVQPYSQELPGVPTSQEGDKPILSPALSPVQGKAEGPVLSPVEGKAEGPILSKAEGTVHISVERLDTLMNLVGELVTDRTRLVQIEDTLRSQYGKDGTIGALGEMATHFDRVVDQLQQEVMQARMLPIAQLFVKFPRLVRDLARAAGKQVNLVVLGEATELDRSVIELIGDPLIHLLRNAVDHGIEPPQERMAAGKPPTSTVWLTAAHKEGHVVITIKDDGRGIDPARIRQAAVRRGLLSKEEAAQLDDDAAVALIFQPNLSTAEQVTEVSGRGVGLDVVRTNVRRLSGSVVVESEVGRGTAFRLTLPLTLAIVQAMMVALGDDVYAVPLTGIVETLYLSDVTVNSMKGNPIIRWRDAVLPLVSLRQFFAHPRLTATPPYDARPAVVTVAWGKLQVGLIVDKLIGKQEIVIKSLSPTIGNVPGLSGCTILGDGRIALIVDIPGLISAAMQTQR